MDTRKHLLHLFGWSISHTCYFDFFGYYTFTKGDEIIGVFYLDRYEAPTICLVSYPENADTNLDFIEQFILTIVDKIMEIGKTERKDDPRYLEHYYRQGYLRNFMSDIFYHYLLTVTNNNRHISGVRAEKMDKIVEQILKKSGIPK